MARATVCRALALGGQDAPAGAGGGGGAARANPNGAAGVCEQDDMDNWRQVTEASKSVIARRFPAQLSMGVGHAGTHDDWPGVVSERYISENNQRLFYQRWEQFMNAGSWADIPPDPIRARFVGPATMRG